MIVKLTLIAAGLVEFALRFLLCLICAATVVGIIIVGEYYEELLHPICWKMLERIL